MSFFAHRILFEGQPGYRVGIAQLGFIVLSSLALLVLFIPMVAAAQESCGDIITEQDGQDERTPIEQCNDPFDVGGASLKWEFNLTLNGGELQNGEEREVETLPANVTFDGVVPDQNYYDFYFVVYRHEGEDYRYIGGAPIGEGGLIITATGTYSIVSTLDFRFPTQSQKTWQNLFASLVPTAHAQVTEYEGYAREVLTFTLTVPEPEPTGASSVLFLPGIQASRLYKEGTLGTEDQLWEPNINQDVSQLAMTESGQSINDIYTRDVVDEVFGVSDIYQTFLDMMEDMVEAREIHEFKPFAYDWRFAASDVVRKGTNYEKGVGYLADEVENLAKNSFTGKVTIIAHSNGGLLAKSLLVEFPELSDLIDKIVFVGTPHLGTPKGIAALLHGHDQQRVGGLIIDDETTREVINNMPGAYGLLPSIKYLTETKSPVIFFRDSVVTDAMRLQYGKTVNTESEYTDFLNGVEGRVNEPENISAPYITNPDLLAEAFAEHDVLDSWVAQGGVEVKNLIGVGLPTISALEYREVIESRCTDTVFGEIICTTDRLIRPYAQFTPYGDETVTAISAESLVGDKYYFDLDKFNRDLINPLSSFQHSDFLEINEVQEFIRNTVKGISSPSAYVSVIRPTLSEEYDVVSVDSPVRIVATDEEGRRSGMVLEGGELKTKESIPNSQYFEFAGTKYLTIPKGSKVTFTLYGQALGGYTLTTATLESGNQVILSELVNATTSRDMMATFTREQDTYSNLRIDLDGDGQVDFVTTLDGEVIPKEESVSYAQLKSEIKALGLKKNRQKVLVTLVNISESFAEKSKVRPVFAKLAKETLRKLCLWVDLYKKKKWLTESEASDLLKTIKQLRDIIK